MEGQEGRYRQPGEFSLSVTSGVDWFEVTEVRGLVKDGEVSEFQVKVKVGFRILSEEEMRGA